MFKLPNRHRRFEYVPRYYDPRKAELEKKIKMATAEADSDKAKSDQRREISFRERTADNWGNSQFKADMMRANIRLIIIFGICLIAFYFLYQYLADVALILDEQTGKQ